MRSIAESTLHPILDRPSNERDEGERRLLVADTGSTLLGLGEALLAGVVSAIVAVILMQKAPTGYTWGTEVLMRSQGDREGVLAVVTLIRRRWWPSNGPVNTEISARLTAGGIHSRLRPTSMQSSWTRGLGRVSGPRIRRSASRKAPSAALGRSPCLALVRSDLGWQCPSFCPSIRYYSVEPSGQAGLPEPPELGERD
jgi:hypothetical protein